MLYPKIAIDVTARLTELPSGNIGLLPLTLADGQVITIRLQQVIVNPDNLPQDRSLRAWISEQPGGRSLSEATNIAHVTLTALNASTIRLVANHQETNEGGLNVGAMPGQYWLNVLNLVNEANSFAIIIEQ